MKTMRRPNVPRTARAGSGFTLIELLVVISIIALLVGILLPALGAARGSAQAIVCGANLHSVGQAMASYTSDNKDLLPPSYVYPYNSRGDWRWRDQFGSGAQQYMHWSFMIYDRVGTGVDAFRCPTLDNGGMPRTFPGDEREDWQGGIRGTNPDLQAPRMAYSANSALVPRNKFAEPGSRQNRLVQVGEVRHGSNTILATEFSENFALVRQGSNISKSHRPITALKAVGAGLQAHKEAGGIAYGRGRWLYGGEPYGLEDYQTLLAQTSGNLTQIDSGGPNINAVGRHHAGGTANFMFLDGHVERSTILETMNERKWGDKFYAVTGPDTGVFDK